MTIDEQIDQLYSLPLGDFTAARNELAKGLRVAGDREGAARVKALTKPSLTAWAVNQIQLHTSGAFDELIASGNAVREAVRLSPAEQQAAVRKRRQAIATLLRDADRLLGEAGHTLSRVHRQRISTTLEAISAGAATETDYGRLTTDLEPAGFDVFTGFQMPSAPAANAGSPSPGSARATKKARRPATTTARSQQRRKNLQAAKERLDTADAELLRFEDAAAAAGAISTAAEAEADRAAERAAATKREARQAASEAARVRKAADSARTKAGLAKTEAKAAKRRTARARRAYDRLTG